ncbi:motility associated factor glycosyltransferase family protein [Candidatus Ozemobacteraceae bacterium]|nr:motility associated factor glycosyltransferase family protein [Candidatus Ozemobacteraceae bacterium]
MESPFLKANLQALLHHPHLVGVAQQHAVTPSDVSYQVEPARTGLPTLTIAAGGKTFSYHSRYDPLAEAARQVKSALQSQHTNVMILGAGLGYLIDIVLASLAGPGVARQVYVVEPDPQVFLRALASRDMRSALNDPRVEWCVGMTPDEFGDRWAMGLDWVSLDALAIVEHPPSLARFHGYFERLKEKVLYLANRSKGNLVTLMHTGNEFHSNSFANLRAALTLPGVGRMFGRFAGVPAVIVAAGPSLEKNAALLAEIRDRFLVIAVDTSFRQLVARNIRPHIVLAADPSYLNSLDFVGVENETGVVLAVEPMTHPDILEQFRGPKMAMTFGGGLQTLTEPFREPTGKVVCWGSIATTAFDLARSCGCDPIVFVGLDLSFQDGKLYARGSYSDDIFYDRVHPYTSLEHETVDYIQTRGTHRIAMSDGTVLFTDQNMHMYRAWFEDQFRQTTAKVINATEGGVVNRHVACMTLTDVVSMYADKGVPIAGIMREVVEKPVNVDVPGMIARLEELMNVLRRQQDDVRRGAALCRKLSGGISRDVQPSALTGPALVQYRELLELHDHLLDDMTIYGWYAVHQTRFVNRHALELKRLRADETAKTLAWIEEIGLFLESVTKFHEYQYPLMETAIRSLSSPSRDAGQERLVMR